MTVGAQLVELGLARTASMPVDEGDAVRAPSGGVAGARPSTMHERAPLRARRPGGRSPTWRTMTSSATATSTPLRPSAASTGPL